jgi:hypothetical protein
MKKIIFVGLIAMLAVMLSMATVYAGPYGPADTQWNYCPYCGSYVGPGGGYNVGPGYGMGPGMMGPGYGMGPGMMGPGTMHRGWGYGRQYGPQYQQPQRPMSEKDAKAILENYLKSTRNPNLKLGKIEDKGNAFQGDIVTAKDGSLVDKILVDKYTGWMRSAY